MNALRYTFHLSFYTKIRFVSQHLYISVLYLNTIIKVCTNDKGLSNREKCLFHTGTLGSHMRFLLFGRPQKVLSHPNVQTSFHNNYMRALLDGLTLRMTY